MQQWLVDELSWRKSNVICTYTTVINCVGQGNDRQMSCTYRDHDVSKPRHTG